jgi:GNAT superfamily N-acetyltransferase
VRQIRITKQQTMSDITIRKYQIGDEKGLTLLAKAVWGSHFDESYWRWKYLENPLGYNFSYVAVSNNNIVGFMGGIPWRLIVIGKELVGAQYTDLMVHPEWRNKGIFFPINRKSLDEAKAKTSFHYGFSTPNSFRIYAKRFRWESFQPFKMQKVIDLKLSILYGLKQRKSFNFSRLTNLIFRFLSSKLISSKNDEPLRTNLVVRKINQFDSRFDELWEKVYMKFNIATIRDSQYLDWRYIRNPQFRYTVFGAEEDGNLSGFVVLRCEKEKDMMRGLIIDLLVDPNQEMTANCLIGESLKFFRSQKVASVNTWMFEHNHIFYGLLRKNGFSLKSTDNVIVVIKSYSQDISNNYLKDTHNWYLTMGDCDVF